MITVSQNDFGYLITDILENSDGTPFDLTGYTVKFHVWAHGSPGTLLVNGTASVINQSAGTVSYAPASTDFPNAGTFEGEWEATKAGIKQSFPTAGFTIKVVESA